MKSAGGHALPGFRFAAAYDVFALHGPVRLRNNRALALVMIVIVKINVDPVIRPAEFTRASGVRQQCRENNGPYSADWGRCPHPVVRSSA